MPEQTSHTRTLPYTSSTFNRQIAIATAYGLRGSAGYCLRIVEGLLYLTDRVLALVDAW